ncbi:MAG TPA: hypothetical protein VH143_34650 [Kofleriaceae bacterium]|nr:hypothetical protein [Kofleriaceae bacterium]
MGIVSALIAACSYPRPADVVASDGASGHVDGSHSDAGAPFDDAGDCPLAQEYPAQTSSGSDQFATTTGSGTQQQLQYQAVVSSTPEVALIIVLRAGTTQFAAGIAPGTYNLATEMNGDPTNCGACVYLADQIDGSGVVHDAYQGQTGMLDLVSVTGAWQGTLSTTIFQHLGSDGVSLDLNCSTILEGTTAMNVTVTD